MRKHEVVSVAEAVGSGQLALGIYGLEAGQVAVVRAGDRGEDREGLGVETTVEGLEILNVLELCFTEKVKTSTTEGDECIACEGSSNVSVSASHHN